MTPINQAESTLQVDFLLSLLKPTVTVFYPIPLTCLTGIVADEQCGDSDVGNHSDGFIREKIYSQWNDNGCSDLWSKPLEQNFYVAESSPTFARVSGAEVKCLDGYWRPVSKTFSKVTRSV